MQHFRTTTSVPQVSEDGGEVEITVELLTRPAATVVSRRWRHRSCDPIRCLGPVIIPHRELSWNGALSNGTKILVPAVDFIWHVVSTANIRLSHGHTHPHR